MGITKRLLLLGILIQLFQSQSSSNPKLLEISKEDFGTSDNGSPVFYRISLPNPLDKDISVSVGPKDFSGAFCDPDLFISKSTQTQDSASDWEFTQYGNDFGVIPKNSLLGIDNLYLTVKSTSKCDFKIEVSLTSERALSASDTISINKNREYIGVYNYRKTTEEKKNIVFTVWSYSAEPFRLFVYKDEIKKGNHIQGSPGFFGGEVVKISKGSKDYCEDCKYYVHVATSESQFISLYVSVQENGDFSEVKSGNTIFGFVNHGELSCYKVDKENVEVTSSYILTITSLSGSDKIFIKYNEKPDLTLPTPNFDNSFNLNEDVVIKLKSDQKKPIYFCLNSESYSIHSYMFKIFLEDDIENTEMETFLNNGISVQGYIPSKKVGKFLVLDWSTNNNITISLEKIRGNAELYGITMNNVRFGRKMNWESLQPYFQEHKILKSTKFISKQSLFISHQVNECQQRSLLIQKQNIYCKIYALVYCNDDVECSFNIGYKAQKSSNLLFPNRPQTHFIPYNDTDYYRFRVLNDTDIDNITIVLNSINGDTDLFVSRTHQFPNSTNADKVSLSPAYSPDIVVFKKDVNTPLTGDYYIAVNAFTYARYTLTYYLKGNQGIIKRNNFVRLTQGVFQKDVINSNEQKSKIFSFYADMRDSINKQLTVILSRESGYFNFELYTGHYSNMTKLASSDNTLTITPFTNGFQEHGIYFVKVSLLRMSSYETYLQNSSSSSDSFGSFRIGFVSGDNSFALEDGLPIHYSFRNNSLAKFVFDFEPNHEFLLSLSDVYPNVNIYLDTYDLGTNYNGSLMVDTVSGLYHANASYFKKKCEDDYHHSCRIFIVIESNNTLHYSWNSRFTILVKHVNDNPVLFSGSLVTNKQLSPGEINYYYHYLTKEDHGALILTPLSGLAQIYVNILNREESSTKIKNWRKPTSEKEDLHSVHDSQGQILNINKELVKNCEPFCVLYFGIVGLRLGYKNPDFIEYSVKFETRVVKLLIDQQYHSKVAQAQYQFFTFKTNPGIKNVYVSLTTTSGYCNLYMNLGEESFPKSNQASWTGTGYKSSFIDISENDQYFIDSKTSIDSQVYTIGVYGQLDSEYTIFVSTNPKKIIPTDRWKASSCLVKTKGELCYFRDPTTFGGSRSYYNNWIKDILASTDFTYGSGRIYAKKYFTSHINIFDDLPSKSNYDWSSDDLNTLNFLQINFKALEEKNRNNQNRNSTYNIIYAVECDDTCLFEFNTAFKETSSSQYLSVNKETIVSVPASATNTFYFYNYMQKDALIGFSMYSGGCTGKVYVNKTNDTPVVIQDFTLDRLSNHKIVKLVSDYKNTMITIQITSNSEITDLKIKIHAFSTYNQVAIGTPTRSYTRDNEEYIGYFYFPSGFKKVTLTAYPLIDKVIGDLYLNIVKVGNSESFNDFIQINVPTYSNHLYHSNSSSLGKMSLSFDKFKQENTQDLYVGIFSINFRLKQNETDSNSTFLPVPTTVSNTNRNDNSTYIPFYLSVNKRMHAVEKLSLQPDFTHYGILNFEENSFDLYEIAPSNNQNDLMIIEFSSCSAKIDFILGDKIPNGELNDYKDLTGLVENYQKETIGGRTIITTKNKNGRKTHYLLIKPNAAETNRLCRVNNQKGCLNVDYVEYYVRYRSVKESELVKFEPADGRGVINWKMEGDRVRLDWSPIVITKANDPNFIPLKQKTGYSVYFSDNEEDIFMMGSICYLQKMDYYYTDENSIKIRFEKEKNYVNIIAFTIEENRNNELKELIAYQPVQILIVKQSKTTFFTVLSVIAVIVLSIVLFLLYKKYVKTKKRLDYEMNDVRNIGSMSKTDEEIEEVQKTNENQKYQEISKAPSII